MQAGLFGFTGSCLSFFGFHRRDASRINNPKHMLSQLPLLLVYSTRVAHRWRAPILRRLPKSLNPFCKSQDEREKKVPAGQQKKKHLSATGEATQNGQAKGCFIAALEGNISSPRRSPTSPGFFGGSDGSKEWPPMACNLIVMASNLLAMASNLYSETLTRRSKKVPLQPSLYRVLARGRPMFVWERKCIACIKMCVLERNGMGESTEKKKHMVFTYHVCLTICSIIVSFAPPGP